MKVHSTLGERRGRFRGNILIANRGKKRLGDIQRPRDPAKPNGSIAMTGYWWASLAESKIEDFDVDPQAARRQQAVEEKTQMHPQAGLRFL
jgi:hypothetical protein